MENKKVVVYVVSYKDDFNRKHITFVRNYSEIKFLKDRFGSIYLEYLDKEENFVA